MLETAETADTRSIKLSFWVICIFHIITISNVKIKIYLNQNSPFQCILWVYSHSILFVYPSSYYKQKSSGAHGANFSHFTECLFERTLFKTKTIHSKMQSLASNLETVANKKNISMTYRCDFNISTWFTSYCKFFIKHFCIPDMLFPEHFCIGDNFFD